MTALTFVEQEGPLGGPTLADVRGVSVRAARDAVFLRFHATLLIGASGTWAIECLAAHDGGACRVAAHYCVRLEPPDTLPQSARVATFVDGGTPMLRVDLAPHHPPVAVHLALLVDYDAAIVKCAEAGAVLLYRLYDPQYETARGKGDADWLDEPLAASPCRASSASEASS